MRPAKFTIIFDQSHVRYGLHIVSPSLLVTLHQSKRQRMAKLDSKILAGYHCNGVAVQGSAKNVD